MERRQLLRAAGVASALGIPNLAAGERDGRRQASPACSLPDCIHPMVGYTGFSLQEVVTLPTERFPDHAVELVTRPRGENRRTAGDEGRPVPEAYFEPTGLAVESGDVVQFTLTSPAHTVSAYHPQLGRQRRVPEGVAPFSSPLLPGGSFWLYRFEEPGVYDLLCAPHELYGMAMRVVVDGGETEFGPVESPGRRAPEGTATLVLDDDALAPGTIVERGEVGWDELAVASKQLLVEFREPLEGFEMRFEGEDTDATKPFELAGGLLVAAYEHEGRGDFIVDLVHTPGAEPGHLIASEFDATTGLTALGIGGGEYLLDVEAGGRWVVELAQPRPGSDDLRELPVTIEGEGADYAGPLLFDGLVRASATHDGSRNFVVEALDEDGGRDGGVLFDESGAFDGGTTFVAEGPGWLVVEADGEWTIALERVE